MDKRILTHGALLPLPQGVLLRAGRLTLLYESGFIRYIRNGSHEIVRMVNHYLRDHNWNTIPMHIHSEQVSTSHDSFRIEYSATIRHEEIDFSWKCSIVGNSDETILFTIDGESHSSFRRNRLGFTVLLPTEPLRGQTCRVTHPDDVTTELLFPDAISPHQPFLNIQSMAWSPASGLQVALTFSGDVFEMEDQRNWMDASHKVYCTPLALGFPKAVGKGDRISQSVHIKVFGDLHDSTSASDGVTFSINGLNGVRLPRVGIPLSDAALTDVHLERITTLGPDFVSVVIRELADLERIPIALLVGRPLEIALFPASIPAEEIALALKKYASHISQLTILVDGKRSADATFIETYLPSLRKHLPRVMIGSGTDAFFTELNRNPTPAQTLDFLSFSVNPQTHAGDLRTMTENLVAHRDVVESCRRLSGGRSVRVGPVTLKMRWNPDATSADAPVSGSLPANVDSRQLSLYAAGWTLGSLKYLTEAGADMVSYYEMTGWRGLMAHHDQPWPDAFGVDSNQRYPVYLMLRELLLRRSAVVLSLTSSDPLMMDGMAFRDEGKIMAIVANYTREALQVALPVGFHASGIRVVGSDNVEDLLSRSGNPLRIEKFEGTKLDLPPFGFALIEGNE